MKKIPLYYWAGHKNFGDELSKYIVEKISGGECFFVKRSAKRKLLAIGSILDRSSAFSLSDIWGSGFLRRDQFKIRFFPIGKNLKYYYSQLFCKSTVHAVRGPLSRDLLIKAGFSVPEIYGDPAILMPKFYSPKNIEKLHDIGIILHHTHETPEILSEIENRGWKLISILREGEQEIHDFIDEVVSCKKIFSTSLHGIILAQVYGIPAQWIRLAGKEIHPDEGFKFHDYFLGAGQEVQRSLYVRSLMDINENFAPPKINAFTNLDKLLNSFPKKYLKG